MSEKYFQEHGIDKALIKKESLKAFLISVLICTVAIIIVILSALGADNDPENWLHRYPPGFLMYLGISLTIFVGIIPVTTIVLIVRTYMTKFVNSFKFKLTSSHLEIRQGVFTKNKATVPYSRIQNINTVNGIFDRIYNLHTVLIETAGFSMGSAQGQSGFGKPEGYIPGLKDPFKFEAELKQMLDKYSVLPSGLEEKIFKPQELAFDNFVSYILTKMRDKDDLLKTNIVELREKQKLSTEDLAQKVGVKNETIVLLEAGRYTPSLSLAYRIARELGCKIEDLFIFE
ncbi:MAG: PH domain-containing protein [Candidatus Helarchaeota archaeon]